MTVVAVINRTPGLEDKTVAFFAEAWNVQACEIADAHGVEYTPVAFFGTAEGLPAADCRVLTIRAEIDAPGALGYHDDVGGAILAEVKFTAGADVTGSHEIAEELGDPRCDRWLPFDRDHEQAGELCDRVEGDSYVQPATVLGETCQIRVSNYLLPSAFDPSGRAPFDRLGRLTAWNGMTPGGYVIVRDITSGQVGNVFAMAQPRIISGPAAGPALAEKLARRGSRLLRRLRG